MKGMVDVGMPRRPITIEKPDREYLNSDVHMNVVCTRRGSAITSMYLFFHRYYPARIFWSSFKVINKLNTGEPNHAFETI